MRARLPDADHRFHHSASPLSVFAVNQPELVLLFNLYRRCSNSAPMGAKELDVALRELNNQGFIRSFKRLSAFKQALDLFPFFVDTKAGSVSFEVRQTTCKPLP
jgi:hypothetical protein